jgi:hypothetical protein
MAGVVEDEEVAVSHEPALTETLTGLGALLVTFTV